MLVHFLFEANGIANNISFECNGMAYVKYFIVEMPKPIWLYEATADNKKCRIFKYLIHAKAIYMRVNEWWELSIMKNNIYGIFGYYQTQYGYENGKWEWIYEHYSYLTSVWSSIKIYGWKYFKLTAYFKYHPSTCFTAFCINSIAAMPNTHSLLFSLACPRFNCGITKYSMFTHSKFELKR